MAPNADATAGASQGWHDLEAVLAEEPAATLLPAYLVPRPALWSHSGSWSPAGRAARPRRRPPADTRPRAPGRLRCGAADPSRLGRPLSGRSHRPGPSRGAAADCTSPARADQ